MTRLVLSFLGPLQITLAGTPLTSFRSDKERALLAFLALEADRPHRREALVGLLWPEQPAALALNNLRKALHRLRQTLGDPAPRSGATDQTNGPVGLGQAPASPYLLITPKTVQFNPASDYQLDVAEFTALLAACRQHTHRSLETCTACSRRLQQAVDLYRGEFLHGFSLADSIAFDEWTLVKREGLRLPALEALYMLTEFYARRSEHRLAQSYALRQLAVEPWREVAWRQLMWALALQGERGAALAQYEACRQLLAAELGVEPEAGTRLLYEQIRRGDPWESAVGLKHNLPVHTIPFIGRETDLARLHDRLLDPAERLLTLVGEGGVGKTRLAGQAVAGVVNDFADGVWFVSLASLSGDGLDIPKTIGTAMGFTFYGERDPKSQLLNYLRYKQCLLILDNFEHVMAGSDLILAILDAAPKVVLLVTSREPLKFQAERVIRLEGLPVPPAVDDVGAQQYSSVQLFVERAERSAGGFSLTAENRAAVIEICRLLDGLPLGIVLAASQTYAQSPEAIARALHSNFDVLAVAMHDLPLQQRSIRAVFEWSWQLLTPDEQAALAQVSIFRGGFTGPAALAVAAAQPETLASLVDKSLLRVTEAGRYEMHEAWRQMAGEKLAASTADAARHRHLMFFQQLAEVSQAVLRSANQLVELQQLETEHDNLRAALSWAETGGAVEQGLWLASHLTAFWRMRGYWREGRARLESLLGRADLAAPPSVRAGGLVAAAMLAWHLGDYTATRSYAEEGAALWRRMGDVGRRGLAYALLQHGAASYAQTDYETALALFEESVLHFRSTDDPWGLGMALNYLGATRMHRDDLGQAPSLLAESRALLQQCGDRWALSMPLNFLASIAWRQAQYETARVRYEEVLAIRHSFRDRGGVASVLNNLGELARYQGDYLRARTLYEECLAAYRELGSPAGVALLLHNLAQVERYDGNYGQAAALFKESLSLYREQGNQLGMAMCLAGLAGTAGANLMNSERSKRAESLSRAAVLFSVTESLLARLNTQFDLADRLEHERHLAAVRAELDQVTLDHAWTQGKAMTLIQAIEFAWLM